MAGRGSKAQDYDEPLPIEMPEQRAVEKEKRRYVKPKAYGKCPGCTAEKVALVQQGKHLVWKLHTYATYGKARLDCVAGGVRLCDLPEGEPPLNPELVHCTCWSG